ncbi:MAG: AAA family ATPase [Verrucomicrobiaceae bacterium]|nr:MAG: AAA family ATPase [Verrucomicrobiaceae bacterium]RPJ30676.1 MAG: AAA family ATPase [Verrucomicrobiaceae bacterium]RPJ33179.1 MAG: AAA family ATPase [Verrucomicrobiaceae bacterium]RPJ36007.1 MAG: AAA family ATPase [Verrucomicrobiaceae bacterium]
MKVTLQQAATLVQTCGHTNTFLLRGAPGIGKSSILTSLARHMPDYHPAYIDCANLDLGDLGLPIIDRPAHAIPTTTYAPNVRFGAHQPRPVLIMLDELGKASRPVLNMLLPVILERRLGDHPLPPGSIVFATTNLDTDGVGDNIPAHAYNRMTVLPIANPTAEEWINWATSSPHNAIAAEVLAFAQEYSQVFECYADDPTTKNPYIFNPLNNQTRAFCSPRSLAHASHIITHRHTLGEATLPALIGTVGESAARDMDALLRLSDKLPPTETITEHPDTAPLPPDTASYFILAFRLAMDTTRTTIAPVMTYINRWESFEARALYITTVAGNRDKAPMACADSLFRRAASDMGKYF